MHGSVAPDHQPSQPWLDRAGMVTSTLCAVHCAATALLMGALTAIGASRLGDPAVEAVFLSASIGLGAISLGQAFPRHRSSRPALWLAIGLVLLLGVRRTAEVPVLEVLVVTAGAFCIVRAHWLNARLVTTCRRPAPAVVG